MSGAKYDLGSTSSPFHVGRRELERIPDKKEQQIVEDTSIFKPNEEYYKTADDNKILEEAVKLAEEKIKPAGKRYNKGKIRYDLMEPYAIEQLAKVFTKGAEKYEPNNWLKGMEWSKMRASLGRHLAAFDACDDFDFDPTCPECQAGTCTNHTGLLHMAQVAWNAMAIVSYYRHYPQGDDRYRRPLKKIGFDVDEVVCDWVGPWCQKYNLPIPNSWSFEWDTKEKFDKLNESGELAEFYLSLPPKILAKDLPIEPACYISHRPVEDTVTKQWLQKHGFPLKPVFHVKNREDKLRVAKEMELDYFVDDNYDTYRMMNDGGICCFLLDAQHNQKYNVGYRRIKSLKELPV
jgi:hypothetical protein